MAVVARVEGARREERQVAPVGGEGGCGVAEPAAGQGDRRAAGGVQVGQHEVALPSLRQGSDQTSQRPSGEKVGEVGLDRAGDGDVADGPVGQVDSRTCRRGRPRRPGRRPGPLQVQDVAQRAGGEPADLAGAGQRVHLERVRAAFVADQDGRAGAAERPDEVGADVGAATSARAGPCRWLSRKARPRRSTRLASPPWSGRSSTSCSVGLEPAAAGARPARPAA